MSLIDSMIGVSIGLSLLWSVAGAVYFGVKLTMIRDNKKVWVLAAICGPLMWVLAIAATIIVLIPGYLIKKFLNRFPCIGITYGKFDYWLEH